MAREARVIMDVADVQALLIKCPIEDCGEETRIPLRKGTKAQVPSIPMRCHYCNEDWGRNSLGREYTESFRSMLFNLARPPERTLSARLEIPGELIDGKQ